TATDANICTGTKNYTLTIIAGTGISGFSPECAPVGASVTIQGTGFTGATAVRFNGVLSQFRVNSDSSITATVPSGANTGPISVTTPKGTLTSQINFKVGPKVTSFTPPSGPVGTIVTINGVNLTGATEVRFNGVLAIFTPVSATSIRATVPAGAKTGRISVTTPNCTGESTAVFKVSPKLTAFTPSSALLGENIQITGMNFTGATAVKFGTITALPFT